MARSTEREVEAGDERPGSFLPDPESPAWARLEDQIAWYDASSEHNQNWFKGLKVFQIATAALIPVAAAADVGAAWIGGAGALIVALEGLQQLQQYQQNWSSYRSTCERLRHEKFLFLSQAGHYAAAERPEALLAERVEGLVSQEHAAWASQQQNEAQAPAGEGA